MNPDNLGNLRRKYSRIRAILTLLGAAVIAVAPPVGLSEDLDFEAHIQPIFEAHCLDCHGPDKQKADFRLDVKSTALQGGTHGPNIVPRASADSRLVQLISASDPDERMPPKGDPLSADEIALIEQWIDAGAQWPDAASAKLPDPTDWWSLQPIARPDIPKLDPSYRDWARNPIDAFVTRKLQENGMRPSPEADRATLIRRLYFDLIGLPPTPEKVDAFVANPDPQAYRKLVDELLDSKRYGERWARHWLDVVHYADTHGYDKDKLRPNAWPYRDYVIRAFNNGKPYTRFVEEQLAGDVLYPSSADGIVATGFIAAGPWDFIGHAEVPETKIDGQIARHLDRDDMVATTMAAFVSSTAECAQCHQHKFDPISQKDYYGLQAVFAALDRADRPYDTDPEVSAKRQAWTQKKRDLEIELDRLEDAIADQGGEELAKLNQDISDAQAKLNPENPAQHGYHSQIAALPDVEKWVQVDLGKSVEIQQIRLIACNDDFNGIGAGFGFPLRFKLEASNDPEFQTSVQTLVDQTQEDFDNPKTEPQAWDVESSPAQYVRATATRLAERQDDYIFALSELEVTNEANGNLAQNAQVTALDSIEAPVRWQKSNLTDGVYPGAVSEDATAQLATLEARRAELIANKVPKKILDQQARARQSLQEVNANFEALPEPQYVYAGTIHHGSGAFRGTGPDGGEPRPIHVLRRGSVLDPAELAPPSALSAVPGPKERFDLPENHSEGARRVALARWITDPKNPLTWRSIVNRIWYYHFGQGIVDSPNDFGRMGKLPTHPNLLDWLATEFRGGSQTFKDLTRLIVTSATYRQSSESIPTYADKDGDNQLLWRMNRRRLEAEPIRDAALAISDSLDTAMGGPAFQDFVIEKPEHSPHYEYRLYDPSDETAFRRSIYRFIVRSQPQPFMTTLDCADPSITVAKRNETQTPLQAMALMNNPLMVTLAKRFAERVDHLPGPLEDKTREAFRLALSRDPNPDELAALTAYAEKHGTPNLCRALFNLNEFVYID